MHSYILRYHGYSEGYVTTLAEDIHGQRRSDMRARITTSSVHLAWTLSRHRNDTNALN